MTENTYIRSNFEIHMIKNQYDFPNIKKGEILSNFKLIRVEEIDKLKG